MKGVVLAPLVLALLSTGAVADSPPPNFGVVVEDGIYRGGQPTEHDLEYLHRLGVKTVLKLNDRDLVEEQAAAERLGLTLVAVPLHVATVGGADSCSDVARALSVLRDRSNWPVYVHCTLGRDRTGYVVGLYRDLVQHWSWPRIREELARYGHAGSVSRRYPLISSSLREHAAACSQLLIVPPAPLPAR